jgi:hypothetical protein
VYVCVFVEQLFHILNSSKHIYQWNSHIRTLSLTHTHTHTHTHSQLSTWGVSTVGVPYALREVQYDWTAFKKKVFGSHAKIFWFHEYVARVCVCVCVCVGVYIYI